jgi:NTP pyrophosphatase (non-canonical NTP hydrolase)
MNTLKKLAKKCHKTTIKKGFKTDCHIKQLLLIGTEVHEAMNNIVINKADYTLRDIVSKYTSLMASFEILRAKYSFEENSKIISGGNLPEELADIIIRVLSYAEGNGINIEKEVLTKMEVNKGRPFRHGKKF